MANPFGLDRVLNNLQQAKQVVPLKIANTTKNYFNKQFKGQMWDGVKWQDVKRRNRTGKRGGRRKKKGSSRNNSAILVQSGRLRRALNNSLKKATFARIEFNVNEAISKGGFNYAPVHNFGTKKVPKRQFMGHTKDLEKQQVNILKNSIDVIWK